MRAYRGKGCRILVDVVRETTEASFPNAIREAADVAELVRGLQASGRWPNEREAVGVVLLDARHRVLGVHVASVGTVCSSSFHPREVFRPAVVAGAAAVVLAHNHPSGDSTPSEQDRLVTERVHAAGELLGIECLDHVVVAAREFHSFASSGGAQ